MSHRTTIRRTTAACFAALLLVSGNVQAAPETAAADAVLKAYVEASGGSANLARIQSRSTQSKVSLGWVSARYTTHLVRPNRFVENGSFLGISSQNGFDGTQGWLKKGKDVTVVQGDELVRILRMRSLDWDQHFKDWYPVRRRLADIERDGMTLQVLELKATTGETQIWRFDAGTGLLRQLEGPQFEKGKDPVHLVTTFDDYRTVDGVVLPFRTLVDDGKRQATIVIESLTHNQPVDPIRFPGSK